MEFTLLWGALAGVGGLYLALRWMARKDTTLCVGDLWDIALGAGLAGLAVGRLAAMIRQGVNPLAHAGDIILIRAGVDTVAASAAALAAAAWLGRRNLREQLDGMAPAVLVGLAGWHLGCLLRESCLGTASSLPWAWAQSGSEITRHPVELYTAAILLIGGHFLFRLRLRYPAPGTIAGAGLAVAGLSRLATEPMRVSLFGGPVGWYAAALIGGATAAIWAATRPRPEPAEDG